MQSRLIRLFDIIFAIFGILLSFPIILLILIIGFFDNGSPLFFQQRLGRNQQPFTVIKFRTMKPSTHSVGTHLVDPSSVTRIGQFLRRSKLDELPQLFNVLWGDMSLVGPRPCLLNQDELIAERSVRGVFAIRPGITGLAQINHIDMSTPRKLSRYDKLLIDHLNPVLYFQLIAATVVGQGRGDRVRH